MEWMQQLLKSMILITAAGQAVVALAQEEPAVKRCYLDGWGDALECYQVPVGDTDNREALAVMVAPAVNSSGREPLYLLAGGPGQAASDLAPLLNAFRKVNRERDIVMVDRRGAGRSGAFNCGFEREMPADLQQFSAGLAECYPQRPGFAEHLNSRQAVEDLERVRHFLGHRKIALWGGSWGTRTALLYQQRHPQSLRALVLDGVAPIDTKVFLTASAAENALQQLADDCAADAGCARFGNWRGALQQLLSDWNDTRAATFPDALTGAPPAEPMPRWALANTIRSALYDPAAAAQLPYAVDQARRGNYLPLSGLAGLFAHSSSGMAMGLTFSVACAEELNRITPDEVARDSAGTFLGTAFFDLFATGCKSWPVQAKPYSVPEPRSEPVLLISGAADPITPPVYARTALGYLSHKQHLVVPGGGHINSRRGCIPDLIAQFLNAPDVPLDQSCVADIQRPPFMIAAYGPAVAAGSPGQSKHQGGKP